MQSTRTLRDAPDGASLGIEAVGGSRVRLGRKQAGWTEVTLIDTDGTPKGWVGSVAVNETADVLGPLDKTLFALACHRQALIFGTSAHYIAAVAALRTDITDGKHDAGIGPYALSAAEWKLNANQPQWSLAAPDEAIESWRLQVAVFAIMARLSQQRLAALLGSEPNPVELYLAQLLGTRAAAAALQDKTKQIAALVSAVEPAEAAADGVDLADFAARHGKLLGAGTVEAGLQTLEAALGKAITDTRSFVKLAGDQLLASTVVPLAPSGTVSGAIDFDSPEIPAGRRNMAELIARRFGERGYGVLQQIAAIANAIGESALNPAAKAGGGEQSWGLFQLNQNGGVGQGFSSSVLKDPERNIAIMLDFIATLASADAAYRAVSSVNDAVAIFVRRFEQPADPGPAIARRSAIAQTLLV
jgi:hypothetical protein